MAENYLLNVNKQENVAVRLVGFVNERECEAILNLEDAAHKISTAGSIRTKDQTDVFGKRFVLVIRVKSKYFGDNVPIVFISPSISQKAYIQGDIEFGCTSKSESGIYEGTKYRFTTIENKSGA